MNGKHITKLGFKNQGIGLALAAANIREKAGLERADILEELRNVQTQPGKYAGGGVYADLADYLLAELAKAEAKKGADLLEKPLPYHQFGAELIEASALSQMDVAMRLPISRAGALMPDAHVGYGLPIGGVLATENAVIPYGVGVDIGCSMMLSILPINPAKLATEEAKTLLMKHTRFGTGVGFEKRERMDHEVLDEDTWQNQGILGHLHEKACSQIGSSGSGNHFVEFGVMTLTDEHEGVPAGQYLAVLSHSGSRGFGAQVAGHFTQIAEKMHPNIDKSAKKLSWLPMDSEEGQAYWEAMNLAGRYALANHEQIHSRLSRALGVKPLTQARNSHNLAWKQMVNGQELIVHRKGATPAAAGQLGIIPGSMADPGYLVRGRGHAEALASASHGAGRQLGRKVAINSLSKKEVTAYLEQNGVTLVGGGMDEAPQAYKRIQDVLAHQTELVDILGEFRPKVVRMAEGKDDI